MKKLVLLLAVTFSVSLFSCGNKAAETTEAPEAEATEVVAEGVEVATPCCENEGCVADSCSADSCCAAAAEVVEAVAE